MLWLILLGVFVLAVVVLITHDLTQRRHAILRNYPVIGHLRYVLESIGPEIRQYLVTDNDEERPFSRDRRRWVYTSSKTRNNYFGFGTDNNIEDPPPGYLIIKHEPFPAGTVAADADPLHPLPCAKVLGAPHGRAKAFRPASIVNISAMSFGSLSGAAVEAMNRGAAASGCLHNTGEGGVSDHHRHGGELIFQLGTGYFGARDEHGRFDLARLVDIVGRDPIRAIEIKLSQGAKPGLGGVLPAPKVTAEIARIRGVPIGVDVVSPSRHQAFGNVDQLLDFIETIAEATGLPVGIKSAVGVDGFWLELADRMADTGTGPDYIAIDGGEGGTGAAPLVFSDHVSLPFRLGFPRVYRHFAERGIHTDIVFVGAGKLGFPEAALYAMTMGCDMVYVAREAMLAVGCIQAQRCHTGRCPTGVATQSAWLMRGLDPTEKSVRCANYLAQLRKELLRLAHVCGEVHPDLVTLDHFELLTDAHGSRPAADSIGYEPGWELPSPGDRAAIREIMALPRDAAPIQHR